MRKHFPDVPRPDADANANADADTNTDPYSDTDTDPYSDTYSHADANTDAVARWKQRDDYGDAESGAVVGSAR